MRTMHKRGISTKTYGGKMQVKKQWLVMGALGAALTVGVAGGAKAQTIKIDGSSTVFPITEAVAEEFGKANPNIRVTVGISGTGGGFKKFGPGETDISDASRPIKAAEASLAGQNNVQFIELPIAFDALTIVVNKDNTWAKSLTTEELKK